MELNQYRQFAVEKLGVKFGNLPLLVTALTHRSYLNEHRKTVSEHNERLEFLGDAVLELVVTEHLYTKYQEPEGILTNWRSALVRTESIGAAGEKLGIEPMLRLSRGEKKANSERGKIQILANAYEAIIGAIYLDQGYEASKMFIEKTLLGELEEIIKSGAWVDPKSKLQELAQERDGATPNYRVLDEEGPDHDKTFTVGVFVNEQLLGKGTGPSKQAAQVESASEAINKYSSN